MVLDSPVNPGSQYETFVSDELIKAIDAKYATIRAREGRGITGLSMGGHGGLYLGFRHQDVFGVAGSMSGESISDHFQQLGNGYTRHLC